MKNFLTLSKKMVFFITLTMLILPPAWAVNWTGVGSIVLGGVSAVFTGMTYSRVKKMDKKWSNGNVQLQKSIDLYQENSEQRYDSIMSELSVVQMEQKETSLEFQRIEQGQKITHKKLDAVLANQEEMKADLDYLVQDAQEKDRKLEEFRIDQKFKSVLDETTKSLFQSKYHAKALINNYFSQIGKTADPELDQMRLDALMISINQALGVMKMQNFNDPELLSFQQELLEAVADVKSNLDNSAIRAKLSPEQVVDLESFSLGVSEAKQVLQKNKVAALKENALPETPFSQQELAQTLSATQKKEKTLQEALETDKQYKSLRKLLEKEPDLETAFSAYKNALNPKADYFIDIFPKEKQLLNEIEKSSKMKTEEKEALYDLIKQNKLLSLKGYEEELQKQNTLISNSKNTLEKEKCALIKERIIEELSPEIYEIRTKLLMNKIAYALLLAQPEKYNIAKYEDLISDILQKNKAELTQTDDLLKQHKNSFAAQAQELNEISSFQKAHYSSDKQVFALKEQDIKFADVLANLKTEGQLQELITFTNRSVGGKISWTLKDAPSQIESKIASLEEDMLNKEKEAFSILKDSHCLATLSEDSIENSSCFDYAQNLIQSFFRSPDSLEQLESLSSELKQLYPLAIEVEAQKGFPLWPEPKKGEMKVRESKGKLYLFSDEDKKWMPVPNSYNFTDSHNSIFWNTKSVPQSQANGAMQVLAGKDLYVAHGDKVSPIKNYYPAEIKGANGSELKMVKDVRNNSNNLHLKIVHGTLAWAPGGITIYTYKWDGLEFKLIGKSVKQESAPEGYEAW